MNEVPKAKFGFGINLEEIRKSAKYAVLLTVISYVIINSLFQLVILYENKNEVLLFSGIWAFFLSAFLGVLTALLFWKKIIAQSFPYYAAACVGVNLLFLAAFYLFAKASRFEIEWQRVLYFKVFYFPPILVSGLAVFTHLLTIFIKKRRR